MTMSDALIIQGLAVECRIGVFEWEKEHPQQLSIDMELAIDAAKAAAKDSMEDAVDYGKLVTRVRQHVQSKSFNLIETVAHELAGILLSETKTSQVRVRVAKRALPGIDCAAVEVRRQAR